MYASVSFQRANLHMCMLHKPQMLHIISKEKEHEQVTYTPLDTKPQTGKNTNEL